MAAVSVLGTGCMKETLPQGSTVTVEQVAAAPNAFQNSVDACTATLVGTPSFGTSYAWDIGYPTFFLMRDMMGQDIAIENDSHSWYSTWYSVSTGLGPRYLNCQVPWTYYYKWINNCNLVLSAAGETPGDDKKAGAGLAHAMRAMFYMDLARMFQYTYVGHEQDGTVPIVTEKTTGAQLTNNPRATNEDMFAFILEDLDKAEALLASYVRPDIYTPNVSVVYGMKARAYLTMENWAKAEEYAKKAQAGYTALTEGEYTDRMTAFNTPTAAWMFGVRYKPSDRSITENDSDTNWASQMCLEVQGGLYGSAYGDPKRMDLHLYSTIPASDFRKKCFVNPTLDAMTADARKQALIDNYSNYPTLIDQAVTGSGSKKYGGISLKFRAAGGDAGRYNPYLATVVSVPLMRVEEMILIEAEAAGMQQESRGITLLTTFAKTRDASYTYNSTSTFQDNVWWQRRVELWGEGFAMYDIKRLNKGIIRSYAGTNHPVGARYNTTDVPYWMNFCIVQTESNYNRAIVNNPTPAKPEDSPEFVW